MPIRLADPQDAEADRQLLVDMAGRVEPIDAMRVAVNRSTRDGADAPPPTHLRMTLTAGADRLPRGPGAPRRRCVAVWPWGRARGRPTARSSRRER
ncbi:hypothetical protein B4N89_00755 [Embleya scabrispora]|uniref:Uncharacterized protein n=1 Tax=Embleya scabrispora TaxID=159449 RepID=A0A1T3NS68_9ACTN|nr:hypothetical protein B4N89_00755 [Embleya scabrispora]